MNEATEQVFDVDIPLISAYLHYWWNFGPEGPNQSGEKQITEVVSENVNRVYIAMLKMVFYTIGSDDSAWMGRLPSESINYALYC